MAEAARAGAAPPGSSRRRRPAGRGRGRRRAPSAGSAPGASESEGCSSIAASCAIQTSVGRSVADAEVDLAGVRPGLDVGRLHPFRPVLGAALLEEGGVEVVDPFREAAQGHRAAAQVGDHRRRHLGVVVDHLALGEAGLRVEHLVEVGELQLTPVDLDLRGSSATAYFEALALAREELSSACGFLRRFGFALLRRGFALCALRRSPPCP